MLDLLWDKQQFDQVQKREHSPRVQLNKMLLQKRFLGIRKRQSAAIESEEKKIKIKHETREHALGKISATIELVS